MSPKKSASGPGPTPGVSPSLSSRSGATLPLQSPVSDSDLLCLKATKTKDESLPDPAHPLRQPGASLVTRSTIVPPGPTTDVVTPSVTRGLVVTMPTNVLLPLPLPLLPFSIPQSPPLAPEATQLLTAPVSPETTNVTKSATPQPVTTMVVTAGPSPLLLQGELPRHPPRGPVPEVTLPATAPV